MWISSRKEEPAHYMLKIENFSLLSDAGMIKFKSDVFEATGYKWRLDLYPNGNKKEKVDDHVSLYVIIRDTESLPKGWEVQVDVNFFIYDHNGHSYVPFQDADGNRTRFHEKKIQWGFHKLISLDYLKENGNGYLFNDSFVFGAEIFSVSKYAQKDRCFSMIKPPATINTYTWKIDKFSAVTEGLLYSEVFKVGKVKWKLLLFPGGNLKGKGKSLSIYLKVHDAASLPDGWRVYAKYKMRVKNQSGDADIEDETENSFCISKDDWGFSCFMTLRELRDVTKGFLVNDVLLVEADISIMGILKDNI